MLFLSIGILGFIFGLTLFIYYAAQVPDPSIIAERHVKESTKIYDTTGNILLYDVHGQEKRTVIPWDQISDTVKHAALAAEDSEFYSHSGIDIKGIIRALYKDITSLSASQGGSTITQQLVKNTILDNGKTISRKIKEIVLSVEIERRFSKDQIFWMYLNQIPYGSNIYGIEAASQTYFAKSANNLTIAQAAALAGMANAPTYYSPYGNNTKELIARTHFVLGRMKSLNMITQAEYDTAIKEDVAFLPRQEKFQAPHFVIMVRDYLIKKYGEDIVDNGGLKVITTLDTKIQQAAEDAVTKYGDINAKRYKANNAALVAADPRNGKIRAMVGSRDYFDIANEGNFNVALANRQPGSSFKPFAYATAFQKGFTDSTILFDVKTEFNPNCNSSGDQVKDQYGLDCYNPQNYSGTFSGPVTARQGLSRSLNIPSVKMLYLAGIDDTINLAQHMGITTLDNRTRFGLSLVLGGAEVHLTDMVAAYGVFANDGLKEAPAFIEKVTAADGTTLEEYKQKEERVLDPQIARLITDILSDNNARGPVFGYNSSLHFSDRPVAAKTGTTQDNRDGWVLGYTPSLVAGVWTGNNDNKSMTKEGAGLSAAGPLWHEFMQKALADQPAENFLKPDPIVTDHIMLNGDYHGYDGIHTILYYVDKNNPLNAAPSNPSSDPQFKNWEEAVRRWVAQSGETEVISTPSPSPSPSPNQLLF